ncbi:MAG: hypothetical protein ACI8R9_000762 [Paraglaciecola sp.]|jgi:hypothetical protein
MIKFPNALLFVAVGIVLIPSTLYATSSITSPNVKSLNPSYIANKSKSFDAAKQQALASKTTKSGMKNHYDTQLGKATFLWGDTQYAKPNLSGMAKKQQAKYSAASYLTKLTGLGTEKTDFNTAVLSSFHDTNRGAQVAKYKQQINGVEVFNREYNVIMDRELNLVASSGYFAQSKPNQRDLSLFVKSGSAEQAIRSAFKDLDDSVDIALSFSKRDGKYEVFNASSLDGIKVMAVNPRAKRVLFDGNDGFKSAFYVEVSLANADSVDSGSYSYVIDTDSNKILLKNSLSANNSEFTYRVYAHADGYPMEGPHGDVQPTFDQEVDTTVILEAPLVTLAFFDKISTQDPWLAEDATTTSGNNVFSYADVVAPDGFTDGDFTADVTSNHTFDYILRPEETENSFNNRKAAIVNLFYMTNFLHDFFYNYGFDEASGNAQLSNYGRGGVEGDPLEVQAQDYSGKNNANMTTPADGGRPRMQQYLFNSKDALVGVDFGATVTSHTSIGLLQSSWLAEFGLAQYSAISADVIRIIDKRAPVNDGCDGLLNKADLAGKIVIIDRGECSFKEKVQRAGKNGAIAVLIVNNIDDGTPAGMGGSGGNNMIPSMGLNFADGAIIYALLDANQVVTVEMFSNYLLKDSSFDNGVIAHEWGHYISNRLVGNANGLGNFQGGAMGEGWGDFHSLMFLALESDSTIPGNEQFQMPYADTTYVVNFNSGFRRMPYSTNMEINPLTFKHIESGSEPPGLPPTNGNSPHAAGEIWATSLWEVYVSLINAHGFATAQDRMANYLIAGYKMTPIAPTFTEARDAILSSVYATDVADFERVLAAFAKRGLGLGAVSPTRFSDDNVGVVESFNTKLATYSSSNVTLNADYDDASVGFCSKDAILDKDETGTLSVSISNQGSERLSGVSALIEVISAHDVTLENEGLITFDDLAPFNSTTSVPIKITLNDANTADTLALKVTFDELVVDDEIVEADELRFSTTVNLDFKKRELVGNQAVDNMETLAIFNNWTENIVIGGELAKGTLSTDTLNTAFFASLNPGIDLGQQTMFLNNNDFESDVAFESDAVQIGYGGDFEISFWHVYWLEEQYDGGVVEVSLNGGNWVDVTSVGGEFDVGYSADLYAKLPGRETFTGLNGDLETSAGNIERINFGTALNGNLIKFRFRIVTDGGVSSLGWVIDNVKFKNIVTSIFSEVVAGDAFACENALPRVNITGVTRISESASGSLIATATDRNADILNYSWTQLSGPVAVLQGADTATLNFTPGAVTADTTLEFKLTVDDGTDSVDVISEVLITNDPIKTVSVTKLRNSGGSMGWISLLLFSMLLFRAKQR